MVEMYLCKTRRKNIHLDCEEHVSINKGLEPRNGCFKCMTNYNRAKLLRRKTLNENGYVAFGQPEQLGSVRDKCGVCLRENARMTKNLMSSGMRICEGCEEKFTYADRIAESVSEIRKDMKVYDVPLNKELGG